ncbi:MAG: YiiG family protein [Candidatus Adiutrix sp.]|jgi:hypothetical protein|nr:YiiG family protein [Candidatus Adiutrix sp.]
MVKNIAVLIFAVFLGACSGAERPEENSAQSAEIEKWNLYVDFGNHLETGFNLALSEYFKAFGNRPDYRPAERVEYVSDFIAAMGAEQSLSRDIEKTLAAAEGSDKELDQATYEMSLQLQALWANLRRARDFHDAGGYPQDNPGLARETHSRIYESYLGLEASYSRFRDLLNKEDSERRRQDLREMTESGLVLRPAMLRLIDDAQALQDHLLSRGLQAANLAELDLEALRPYYESYIRSFDDFEKANESVKAAREGLAGQVLPRFRSQAAALTVSIRRLIELRRRGLDLDGDPENTPGGPENIGLELGRLVDLYNEAIH